MATRRKPIAQGPRPSAPPSGDAPRPRVSARLPVVDAARGLALGMMFAYHFCIDLNYFGVTQQQFDVDWRWLTARTIILSSFLLLVGVSLALHQARAFSWRRHWLRVAQIAACAALVSAATYFAFAQRWIYFGVLHFIALASLLALPFVRLRRLNLLLGVVFIALGAFAQHAFFDQPGWHWFGLMTYKPRTEDYVPLLPWFGVVLIGIYIGQRLHKLPAGHAVTAWAPRGRIGSLLVWGGRHSLLLYMVHQPIFFALLYLALGQTW